MSQKRWSRVDDYFESVVLGADPVLSATLESSRRAGLPPIAVSPLQGRLLTLLARAARARRILELGTLGGYSTICLARALPQSGRLTTLELDPTCARIAAANLEHAGLAGLVDIRLGPALDSLALLANERTRFDLIFIDADKPSYPDYLDWSITLAAPGCVIIADNVVRDGEVVRPSSREPAVRGVREMLRRAARNPRLRGTAIQTVGAKGYDGFAMWIVDPAAPDGEINPRRSSSRRASSAPPRPPRRPRPRR